MRPTAPPASVRARTVTALALPSAAVTALAFASGGFSPTPTAAAAVIVLAACVVAAAVSRNPLRRFGPAVLVALTSFVVFAAWCLASSAWSDAPARAVLEYDRILLYLGTLVLFAGLGGDRLLASRMALGLGGAFVVVSLVALGAYLLPADLPLPDVETRKRLSWPTSYWNTTGLLGALAGLSLLHAVSSVRVRPLLRVASAACVPIAAAVVWFSVSRGALLVFLVGAVVLMGLTRSRGLLTGLPVFVASAAATCLVCARATGLTDDRVLPAGLSSGRGTALTLVLVACGTAVLRAVALVGDRRLATIRRPAVSPRAVRAVLVTGLMTLAVGFVVLGGAQRAADAWEDFSSDAPVSSTVPAQRFTQVGNNGRLAHYRVAIHDGLGEDVLRGTGAGTFALLWARHREDDLNVVDAHSLYVEVLAELGLVGLTSLLVVLASLLRALLRRGRTEQGPWALLAALAAGWAVGAGFDWYWEMPAVTVWFFAAGGLALSRTSERVGTSSPPGRPLATWARVATVVALVLLATTPAAVNRSQVGLNDAIAAFREGDCATTARRSLAAADALNSRPEPFELLSYCDVRDGRTALAVQAARAAVERDPGNWEFHYVLALALAAGGQDPRPSTRAALLRNPRDARARSVERAFRTADAREWRGLALASPTLVPGQP